MQPPDQRHGPLDAFFKLEPDYPPEDSAFGDDTGPFEHIRFRFSCVQSVADANRATLESSENLHLFLNANLVDIELDDRLQAVTNLVFRSFERDEPFRVTARTCVLCLGGLENPRALLNANRYCKLHDIDNLYLGDCSTFATGGHANPTYTITQLALRLADHLHDRAREAARPTGNSSPVDATAG